MPHKQSASYDSARRKKETNGILLRPYPAERGCAGYILRWIYRGLTGSFENPQFRKGSAHDQVPSVADKDRPLTVDHFHFVPD